MATSPGAAATTKLNELLDAVAPFASVTTAVIAKVPDWVGVPERTPAELKVIPVGKVLAVAKVLGVDPPEAVRVRVYAEFTVAAKPVEGVFITRAGATVSTASFEVAVLVVPFKELVTTTV